VTSRAQEFRFSVAGSMQACALVEISGPCRCGSSARRVRPNQRFVVMDRVTWAQIPVRRPGRSGHFRAASDGRFSRLLHRRSGRIGLSSLTHRSGSRCSRGMRSRIPRGRCRSGQRYDSDSAVCKLLISRWLTLDKCLEPISYRMLTSEVAAPGQWQSCPLPRAPSRARCGLTVRRTAA
jgi:hypothetical protein